jgi:hypothetical protein
MTTCSNCGHDTTLDSGFAYCRNCSQIAKGDWIVRPGYVVTFNAWFVRASSSDLAS